jgi:hypothetical protein
MKGNNQNETNSNDEHDIGDILIARQRGRRLKPKLDGRYLNKSGDKLLPERGDGELEALWPDQAASRSFRESIGSEQEAFEADTKSGAHSDQAAIGSSADDEQARSSKASRSDSGQLPHPRVGATRRQCQNGDEMRDLVYAVIILALIAVGGYGEYRKQETAKLGNRVYLKCIEAGKFADECIEAKMGLYYTIG